MSLTIHRFTSANAALVLSLAAFGAQAAERADAPGEVRIFVSAPSPQSTLALRHGWLDQEFAKVNKRVVLTAEAEAADAIWREDGVLRPTVALLATKPDAADRVVKVAARTQRSLAGAQQASELEQYANVSTSHLGRSAHVTKASPND